MDGTENEVMGVEALLPNPNKSNDKLIAALLNMVTQTRQELHERYAQLEKRLMTYQELLEQIKANQAAVAAKADKAATDAAASLQADATQDTSIESVRAIAQASADADAAQGTEIAALRADLIALAEAVAGGVVVAPPVEPAGKARK